MSHQQAPSRWGSKAITGTNQRRPIPVMAVNWLRDSVAKNHLEVTIRCLQPVARAVDAIGIAPCGKGFEELRLPSAPARVHP